MTNEEKIILLLQKKYNDSKTNEIHIGKNDVIQIGLTEQEIVKSIFLLQDDGILNIKKKSVHNDFSMYWTLALNSECIYYFDNKRTNKISNRREWIKTYIPITISAIALLKSFQSEIILAFHELLKLLTQLLEK